MAQIAAQLLAAAIATGPDVLIPFGGTYQLIVSATAWAGATAALQVKNSDGAYIAMGAGASFTADGTAAVVIGDGATVRMVITGGPPTAVTAWLRRADG